MNKKNETYWHALNHGKIKAETLAALQESIEAIEGEFTALDLYCELRARGCELVPTDLLEKLLEAEVRD